MKSVSPLLGRIFLRVTHIRTIEVSNCGTLTESKETDPAKYHGQDERSRRCRYRMADQSNEYILPNQDCNLPKEQHCVDDP